MATTDNERYLRYILLLGKGGPLVLKGIINCQVLKEGKTLSQFLLENNGRLRQLIRSDSQYERVFPSASPVNNDLDTWDISLLCLVLLNIFGSKLSSQERNDIKSIRTFRNEIQGHFSSPSLEEIEYNGLRNDLIQVLLRLSSGLSRLIHDSCQDLIKTSASGPLEISSVLGDLKEFHELSTQMKSDHGATHVKLEDLHNDVKEIKKLQELFVQSEGKHKVERQSPETSPGTDGIKNHGYEYWMKVDDQINRRTESLNNVPTTLTIAVIGQSATGKSSLLNALLGIDPCDWRAASVGVGSTSVKEIEYYAHPQNKKLEISDHPSLGALRLPMESNLEQVNLNLFDVFLLCVGVRLTETDITIVKEICSLGKRYYIIRSKVDLDVYDLQLRSKSMYNRELNKRLRNIRGKIERHTDILPGKPPIFFISSYETTKYDFPKLIEQLQNDGFVFYTSKSYIQEKYEHNTENIQYIYDFDNDFITRKAVIYQKEFHLSDHNIAQYASLCNMTESSFRTKTKLKIPSGSEPFLDYIRSVEEVKMNILWKIATYIPVIGDSVRAKFARTILQKILDDCRDDAIRVYDFLTTFSSDK